jgi:very-short-patch-repair endonuclease
MHNMCTAGAITWLEGVVRGRVVTVFTDDVYSTWRELVADAELCSPTPTLVSVRWQHAPPPDERQEQALRAVAQAARSLWPRWYATVDERFDRERWPEAEIELCLAAARAVAPTVSASWLRRAWRHCQRGREPLLRVTPAAEQLRQLALALDPTGPVFLLAVSEADGPPERLHALARSTEWVASQADARTLLVVPSDWRDRIELDIVTYGAVEHRPAAELEAVKTPASHHPGPADAPEVVVEPHVGSPHPNSAAEQRLCTLLASDAELSGLFEFNCVVRGFLESCYRVDLVWHAGKLVVEVDGPEHRSLGHYRADRERDYRLLVAGYTVVRTTNADVLEDAALVVEKLRNVVRLRRPRETQQ